MDIPGARAETQFPGPVASRPDPPRRRRRLGGSLSRLARIWFSVRGRTTLFAALSFIVALAGCVGLTLFAFRTDHNIATQLARAEAASATASVLRGSVNQAKGIVDGLATEPGAGRQVAVRNAAAAMRDEIRRCLANAMPGCAGLPAAVSRKIEAALAEVVITADEATRGADARDGWFAQAHARFDDAADVVHVAISDWQATQFQEHLRGMAASAAHARALALKVAGGTALLLALGALGFFAVQRGMSRLQQLTRAMLRLADGDTGVAIPFRDARDEIGEMARALGVFLLTARRLASGKADLRQANSRLDAALNSMSQGLCMFDAQDRLVVCNKQARTMHGLPPDAPVEGLTFDELVDHIAATGGLLLPHPAALKQRVHDYVARREPVTYTSVLPDGHVWSRWIAPLEGGGWISTIEDVTEQRAAEIRFAHLARHDALTGLANRVLFQAELERAAADARRGRGFAVHCIDLDDFKDVNDTLGHPAGDALLRAIAERLLAAAGQANLVARLGGDEFAIVQFGVSRPEEVVDLAQRVSAAFARPFALDGHHVNISICIGSATAPLAGTEADELIRKADLALYQAKADGHGAHRCYEPGMSQRLQAKRGLADELRNALANHELELHYQVQVDLATRQTIGFEALLRWRSPTRGQVPPCEFIPIAEETRLIMPIGEWAIRQACADAAAWPDGVTVAVNISVVQFRSDALVPSIQHALAESGLPPHRLEIEITESTLLQQSEENLRTLHAIRGMGVRISMDDFGTGYSSLSYLQRFPFDTIKIDRSFVSGLDGGEGSDAIVRAVSALGASLGIEVIAEGIETEAQAAQVQAEGCRRGQGYLFSKPRPVAELTPLLQTAARGGAPQLSEPAGCP